MSIVPIATLKSYFQTGDRPTQSNFEDLIDTLASEIVYLSSVSGTDTITATGPGLSSYTAGDVFFLTLTGTNTGAATIDIDSVGPVSIEKSNTALVAADLTSGDSILILYDGSAFQMLSPARTPVLTAGGVPLTAIATQAANTFVANATSGAASPTASVALSASQLAGMGASGDLAAITLGTGLSMSGTTLNASVSTPVVIQVKRVFKDDTFTMSSTTPADVTGLSVSITPTSASNAIRITGCISMGVNFAADTGAMYLVRNSTIIDLGATAGSRTSVTGSTGATGVANVIMIPIDYIDTPATTSATTYKIQISALTGANAVYVNRSHTDTNSAGFVRGASHLTVEEIVLS